MQDEKPFAFVVYGQPATKKNSAVMVARRATLLPSKAYRAYEKVFRAAMRELKARLGDLPHYDGPVQLTAKYYLESRAHYPDLSGLLQATQDIISDEYALVTDKATGKRRRQRSRRWILSDDRIVKSLDGSRIAGIDKEKPRVEIYIKPLLLNPETETDPQLVKLAKARMTQELFENEKGGNDG